MHRETNSANCAASSNLPLLLLLLLLLLLMLLLLCVLLLLPVLLLLLLLLRDWQQLHCSRLGCIWRDLRGPLRFAAHSQVDAPQVLFRV